MSREKMAERALGEQPGNRSIKKFPHFFPSLSILGSLLFSQDFHLFFFSLEISEVPRSISLPRPLRVKPKSVPPKKIVSLNIRCFFVAALPWAFLLVLLPLDDVVALIYRDLLTLSGLTSPFLPRKDPSPPQKWVWARPLCWNLAPAISLNTKGISCSKSFSWLMSCHGILFLFFLFSCVSFNIV